MTTGFQLFFSSFQFTLHEWKCWIKFFCVCFVCSRFGWFVRSGQIFPRVLIMAHIYLHETFAV